MISAGETKGGVTATPKPELVWMYDPMRGPMNMSGALVRVRNEKSVDYYRIKAEKVESYFSCEGDSKVEGRAVIGNCIALGVADIPDSKQSLFPKIKATPQAELSHVIQRLRKMLANNHPDVQIETTVDGKQTAYHVQVPGRSEPVANYHIYGAGLYHGGAHDASLYYGGAQCSLDNVKKGNRCYLFADGFNQGPIGSGVEDAFEELRKTLRQKVQQQIALREKGK